MRIHRRAYRRLLSRVFNFDLGFSGSWVIALCSVYIASFKHFQLIMYSEFSLRTSNNEVTRDSVASNSEHLQKLQYCNKVSHRIASTLKHGHPLITRSSPDKKVLSDLVVWQMTSLSDLSYSLLFAWTALVSPSFLTVLEFSSGGIHRRSCLSQMDSPAQELILFSQTYLFSNSPFGA
jgi:hypothetical protein